ALARAPDNDEAEQDLVGKTVDGRYHVMELIGEGGMGKVYLAEHVEIGKRVALKVLHPSYSRMPDLVERFRREARAASKIGHPNIVDVTDSGTTPDGSVYFVMEYLEGVELGSVIEREGAIDIARALRISSQICRALAAAHAQGIVHRDLKPENVFLITRDGAADVVKVLDFGIAKTTEAEAARERRLTSPGMAMGTPEYMAPEQAAGRPADARCDVYALGAIMYEMVSGQAPYSGDNFMEILTKKATLDPPAPITLREDLPLPISDLVMAAMARNPDSRPQTMETLEYELNKCLSGRGIAVANILGMTTDPTVVATLNPGLSMRNTDEGIVTPRGASNAGLSLPRAGTHGGMSELPGMWSGPTMSTGTSQRLPPARPSEPLIGAGSDPGLSGQLAAAAASLRSPTPAPVRASSMGDSSNPAVQVPTSGSLSLAPKRSALGMLGWLLLGAILFGGVGALVYVALGERGERQPQQNNQVTPPSDDTGTGSAEPDPTTKTPAGSGSAVVAPPDKGPENTAGSNATKDATPDKDPPDKTTPDKGTGKRPPKGTPPKKNPVVAVAVNEKDPKALLKQGESLETAGEWEQARGVWAKLEKIKGYGPNAVYRQAWAAFSGQDTEDAVRLAARAASMSPPGAQKTKAKFLYGDALYRQGAYDRAKDVYISLWKQSAGDDKATAQKKVAACNRALKKSETDGLQP
ncbi:MAG: protein kinase, partial [Deltaproteobacteria bacterium]|nr:protein kinase [Deltaproteobacteria bacterium]